MDGKSVAGAVPKIRLRINVPESDAAATTMRSSVECESRSVSELQSMSLGDDFGEDDATTMGGTTFLSFLSPPTTSKRTDERSGGRRDGTSGTTPTSSERASSPASKRPRMSNDWVEDEVHPSKVWSTPGGSAGKRMMMSEVMASTMRRALEFTRGPGGAGGVGTGAGADDDSVHMGEVTTSYTAPSVGNGTMSLLKRTLSGTYDDGGFGFFLPGGFPTYPPGDLPRGDHPSSGGLPPSSPSDPAPLHDLRKAALMRSRLLNAGRGEGDVEGGSRRRGEPKQ